jgi:transcription elongation factor Elf1
MAEVYVWWDELEDQNLPNRCMRCGKKKAEWCPLTIFMESYPLKKSRAIEVLLCPSHQGLSLTQISATSWDKNGVWLMNIHPDFIEALEERRGKKPGQRAKKKKDGEDDEEERPRRAPPRPTYPWWRLIILLVFLLFFMCIPCMIGVGIFVSNRM